MKYRIRRVHEYNGELSPYWTIDIYRNGRLYTESSVEDNSLFRVIKAWVKLTFL